MVMNSPQRRRPGRRQRVLLLGITAAFLCSAFFLRRTFPRPPARSSEALADLAANESGNARTPQPVAAESLPRERSPDAVVRGEPTSASVEKSLTPEQRDALYPPHSRPISQQRAEAFRYNHRVPYPVPIFGKGTHEHPRFYATFTADKMNVVGSETITMTLRATQTLEADAPALAITMVSAGLAKGRTGKGDVVADLVFHDDGHDGDAVAGDRTFTAVVQPASIEALADHHGSVRAFAEFSVNDTTAAEQLFFEYYPEKGIAARLTGNFHEAIEDGSLVVYAQMNVFKAGYYSIDANLLTADDRAFAHARFKGTLEKGIRDARFLFFGKIIRDAKPPVRSPFKVAEIYGQMVPEPKELLGAAQTGTFAPSLVPLYPGTYVTEAYDPSTFSDAAWRSPGRPSPSSAAVVLSSRR
jgi:hypothetical protein